MPFRASPLRNVAALALAGVVPGTGDGTNGAGVGGHVPGTDFTQANAVSLSTSTVTHANGQAQGVYAVLPDKHDYDYLRFSFGAPALGSADVACVLGVWMRESDGSLRLIGQSTLANGEFPSVDVPNYDGRYWIAPLSFSGTTATLSVAVSVQGLYSIPTVFAQA